MPKHVIDLPASTDERRSSTLTSTPGLATTDSAWIPCVYCRGPMDTASFVYSSATERLVSAVCPGCGHAITVATVTWRRWIASGDATHQINLVT